MFRIPWKHAGKQDFRKDEDAAIFKVTTGCLAPPPKKHPKNTPKKNAHTQSCHSPLTAPPFPPQAWAEFKGKLSGGGDNPASWKTRLRCALNKSPEFTEVTERAQLDISEPYKVYRLVPLSEQGEELQPGWLQVLLLSCVRRVERSRSPAWVCAADSGETPAG